MSTLSIQSMCGSRKFRLGRGSRLNWQEEPTFDNAFFSLQRILQFLFVLFDLIFYVPSTNIQLCRDGSSWVEPVISKD